MPILQYDFGVYHYNQSVLSVPNSVAGAYPLTVPIGTLPMNGTGTTTTASNYAVTGNIDGLLLTRPWSLMVIGKFAGTSNYPFGLSDPLTSSKYNVAQYHGSGKIYMASNSNTGVTNSGDLSVPTDAYVGLLMSSDGTTVTLKRMDDGTSVTVGAATVTDAMCLGVGQSGTSGGFPADVAIFNNAAMWLSNLGTTDQQAAYNYFLKLNHKRGVELRQWHVVADGDSLTLGTGATNAATQSYPAQLKTMCAGKVDVTNLGVTGHNAGQVPHAGYDTPFKAARTKNVYVLWIGTNIASLTPAQAYADIVAACGTARATGYKVLVGTIINRTDVDNEAYRATLNASIRSGWNTIADGLVDFAADSRLGGVTAANSTVWFNADKVHLNASGYTIIANIVKTAIDALP